MPSRLDPPGLFQRLFIGCFKILLMSIFLVLAIDLFKTIWIWVVLIASIGFVIYAAIMWNRHRNQW